ncbi:U3 small nucleolar ribonucleoprotein protein IMP3 isoform X2 [Amborella trichopoda]|uniref:U3 small nucleolar ribonucleoprotein protein IMP3 isoform X2 n=1 Tax=Amborella trichopoda TaxID=13333 RepID=UPI0005D3087C|nr:U3 small nucleolar ribonucleoprotein protein IMP3 isoform X2 [Amborella trichopoda]|eukprot:XP_011628669.1 U3 small nucleolar ribonucleoprotein protein IMP3 isoform X2 [Amborella trichopoda]
MRKLKFHEKKLTKKVNFLDWKREDGHREAMVMQRYHVTGRDDYKKYNIGVIPTKKGLSLCDRLSVSSFCRRRLATVLVRLKFAEHLKEAVTYIEQGHIRVGPETVTDPAFLVTRNMEDFVTWVDTSKIRRKVLQYNEKLDDYDLLN